MKALYTNIPARLVAPVAPLREEQQSHHMSCCQQRQLPFPCALPFFLALVRNSKPGLPQKRRSQARHLPLAANQEAFELVSMETDGPEEGWVWSQSYRSRCDQRDMCKVEGSE